MAAKADPSGRTLHCKNHFGPTDEKLVSSLGLFALVIDETEPTASRVPSDGEVTTTRLVRNWGEIHVERQSSRVRWVAGGIL